LILCHPLGHWIFDFLFTLDLPLIKLAIGDWKFFFHPIQTKVNFMCSTVYKLTLNSA
jgi:hypothetical protein